MADLVYLKDFDPWCSLCDRRLLHLVHDSPPLCAECHHPEHLPAGCEIVVWSSGYVPEAMDPPEYCECGPLEEIDN